MSHFQKKAYRTIHSLGIVPFIRMMPRTDFQEGKREPIYTLQRIIEGKFDDELKVWANDAKNMHFPILVEFGPEMNGDWFPWSGIINGGGKNNGYGRSQVCGWPRKIQGRI